MHTIPTEEEKLILVTDKPDEWGYTSNYTARRVTGLLGWIARKLYRERIYTLHENITMAAAFNRTMRRADVRGRVARSLMSKNTLLSTTQKGKHGEP